MSDEDNMALNQDSGEDTTKSTTPVEEIETTQELPIDREMQPDDIESDQERESESKKGYSKRVQELANKAKEEKNRADSLQKKLSELTKGQGFDDTNNQNTNFDLPPLVQDGEELTAEELNKRIAERDHRLLQIAASQTQILTQQSRVLDKINKDARSLIKKYPQLNPEDESFNPKLSSAITKATESYVRANPTASVKKFVNELMEPYQQSIEKAVGDQSQEVVKQIRQTALRPTNIKQDEKTAKDKSIAELERELGIVQS